MTMKALIALVMVVASAAIIYGCTSSERASASLDSTMASQKVQRVQVGTVVKLREISLADDRVQLDSRAETQGRTVAQVGGAVLSAIADESTDDHAIQTDAQEITVRVDGGAISVVTQLKTENLQLNQRVKVINSQQNTRVITF
jgi:outer membrane lipoprotein SlyB